MLEIFLHSDLSPQISGARYEHPTAFALLNEAAIAADKNPLPLVNIATSDIFAVNEVDSSANDCYQLQPLQSGGCTMDTRLPNDPQFIKNYTKHCKYLKLNGLQPKTIKSN